jgi:hypothetical protein
VPRTEPTCTITQQNETKQITRLNKTKQKASPNKTYNKSESNKESAQNKTKQITSPNKTKHKMSGLNKVMIDVGAESEVENDCLMQKSIDWNNLPFVKPNKVLVTEYWEFVALVAPTAIEKKEWNKGDAICTYCMKCKMKIQWSIKNPKQVLCHMYKYHTNFLAQLTKCKEASSTMATESKTMQYFFSKKLKKDLLPAQKGEAL